MDTSSPEFLEALRDHARNLGVDPDAESYLLPLVQEALLAELPADWEQGETEDGALYYFNPTTEESIWEHPLDGHYRELIQTKKDEHAAEVTEVAPLSPIVDFPQAKAIETKPTKPAAINSVDVYSFDDMSDEETATSPVPAPATRKSRISDLFATPTQSTSTSAAPERPQTATPATTGFGFGRDRSWLLDDNDNDVTPIKPTSQVKETTPTPIDLGTSATTSRISSFGSRRSTGAPVMSLASMSSITSATTEAVTPISTTFQTPTQNAEIASGRSFKDPFSQAGSSTVATPSQPSPGTIAKLQQLEKKLANANSDLDREKAAHADTTRQLETAQQEAKESNYLKMKVNELKTKLADQERAASTASARDKQQLDRLTEQENASSSREIRLTEKLAKLEAENARLINQQTQSQSEQTEAQRREAQQNRDALDKKQSELDELHKRLTELQQQMKAASETHDKAQTDLLHKLTEQEASAEAARSQQLKDAAALREQVDKLEQQLRSSKTSADEQASKSEQIDKLQQELSTVRNTSTEQAAKCEKLEQELRSLKVIANERAAKCEQLEKVQQELRTLRSACDDQASLCRQLSSTQDDLVKQEKLRREAEEKNRELQAQVDRLTRDNLEASRKTSSLVLDLEAKKTESFSLQSALSKAQDEIRTLSSSFEQQRHQQQQTIERERITADAETQAQTRIQKLQTQLAAQLDEQVALRAKLQSEVLELRGDLACVQAQEVKPLEKLRDQLQRELERISERNSVLEKELRSARQELSGQTDRAHQLEIEVDVLARREQQRKSQTDALTTAKNSAEKQLASLQDELLTAQHDRRVDVDKLSFRVRELESQLSQKEYEAARVEERFNKAEAWRVKEAARVEKRDAQILELREQLGALQARHVEVETSTEIQEVRAAKQKVELKLQQLERELIDERDARKRDEIRRTEELQRMQQAVEWQLPQLAQACVTRSSDEWTRKCRAVAKKLRDELNMRALQDRNEVVAREQQAREACDRAEQKLKTAVAESDFLRREVSRLEDNNKVLLEQLHTIRVYLTQRPHAGNMNAAPWNWQGNTQPSSQTPPAPSAPNGASIPFTSFSDLSTVNQLNTQLGILHAQFQQLFDASDRRRSPTFSPSDRFEFPNSPTGSTRAASPRFNKGRDVDTRRDEDAEVERLAMDALMDQKLAACNSGHLEPSGAATSLQRQQEELLNSLESLGEAPERQWLPVSNTVVSVQDDEPHSTMWYQRDYWRSKYQ